VALIDALRDLTNAINKAMNGAKTLAGSPTPTEQTAAVMGELGAAANVVSVITDGLKKVIPGFPTGATQIVSGGSAIVNVLNLEAQTKLLNEALASGNTEKIVAASLDFGSSVAGVIGSAPIPAIQAEAKAIAIALSAASALYKNRSDVASGTIALLDETTGLVGQLFNDISDELANKFLNFFLPGGMRPVDRGTNISFNLSRAWFQRRDPLTLDLDGDGLETVGIDPTNPILFDHDGDGIKNATGWIKPDDGFLIYIGDRPRLKSRRWRGGEGRGEIGRKTGQATGLAVLLGAGWAGRK
jgi:hypothetical protein